MNHILQLVIVELHSMIFTYGIFNQKDQVQETNYFDCKVLNYDHNAYQSQIEEYYYRCGFSAD